MLMQKPTPAMYAEWLNVWNEYKDKLAPNRKSGGELIDYLFDNYTLTVLDNERALEVVTQNITQNPHIAQKLPLGEEPAPKAFLVEPTGRGKELYDNRDEVFRDVERIFVGVDAASGYFLVEGSSLLWDELCAFQGLDRDDLQNSFLVAQYVGCLKRFGRLADAFKQNGAS